MPKTKFFRLFALVADPLVVFLLLFIQVFPAPLFAAFMPVKSLLEASKVARTDNVGAGWCGRGVWSVLEEIGYGEGIKSANGQDWEVVLHQAGWVPLICPDPSHAPLGSVVVYLSDMRVHGQNLVGTKGGVYGHVELVALDENARRVYVSDKPRVKPGGTVPANFTRRAWIPPGFTFPRGVNPLPPSSYDPKKISEMANQLKEERIDLAMAIFARRS
jgi:hypothetical protein